jgi:putative Mg2+ transporter-C (MgtC) family protein
MTPRMPVGSDGGFSMDLGSASRVLQGVIAGIGFIGGGVILRGRAPQEVQGLSTAASIWVVTAVGIAAGLGLWRAAVAAVVLTLIVLALGPRLDRMLRQRAE